MMQGMGGGAGGAGGSMDFEVSKPAIELFDSQLGHLRLISSCLPGNRRP